MKSQRLTLLISPEDKRHFKSLADDRGVTMSELVRQAVHAYGVTSIDDPRELAALTAELRDAIALDAQGPAQRERVGRARAREHRFAQAEALMGALADAIAVLKDVLRMRDDLDRLSKNVDKLANAANEIDKRLIRIETMVELAEKRSAVNSGAFRRSNAGSSFSRPARSSVLASRPFLFCLDAERAHDVSLASIEAAYRTGLNPLLAAKPAPLPTRVFGIDFPNPVGLAAGLDKNGAHIDALASLGFGHIEVGTTTPRAQTGNPKPRMFRLPERQAVINRLGFNNGGVDALVRNVERARFSGVLGINIGKNKDTPNERAVDDYLHCLERVYARATYVTVNISSPNTQGLRDLQDEETLRRFIGTLRERQEQLASQHGARKPMLLKIAPDLSDTELDAIAEVLLAADIDGLICTNTTVARDMVAGARHADEAGGLSGKPLLAKANAVLGGMARRLRGKIPLVGVGGIVDGNDAASKIAAGASLVQFYTGMVFRGPALIAESVEAIRSMGPRR